MYKRRRVGRESVVFCEGWAMLAKLIPEEVLGYVDEKMKALVSTRSRLLLRNSMETYLLHNHDR